MRFRLGITMAALAAALMTAPSGASAAEQCLFQGLKVSTATQGKVERSLLCLTNLHRFRNGLPAYRRDSRLGTAARNHSADMVARGYFDHDNPEGAGPSDRAMAAGYPGGAGENIATNGTGTAASLFTQWKLSPGHNENMLGSYVAAGMGVAPGSPVGGVITGTQTFGFAPANTGDTGLDLYASSDKCAKARKKLMHAKKQKRGPLRRAVRRFCKPLR